MPAGHLPIRRLFTPPPPLHTLRRSYSHPPSRASSRRPSRPASRPSTAAQGTGYRVQDTCSRPSTAAPTHAPRRECHGGSYTCSSHSSSGYRVQDTCSSYSSSPRPLSAASKGPGGQGARERSSYGSSIYSSSSRPLSARVGTLGGALTPPPLSPPHSPQPGAVPGPMAPWPHSPQPGAARPRSARISAQHVNSLGVPCTLYPLSVLPLCDLYPVPRTMYPIPCTLYPACQLSCVQPLCDLYPVLCTLHVNSLGVLPLCYLSVVLPLCDLSATSALCKGLEPNGRYPVPCTLYTVHCYLRSVQRSRTERPRLYPERSSGLAD